MVLWPTYSYAREVIRGVRRFAAERHPEWVLTTYMPDPKDLGTLRDARFDGAITMAGDEDIDRLLASMDRPMVNTSGLLLDSRLPQVIPDNRRVGQLAAETFLRSGLRHFACIPEAWQGFSIERAIGFTDAIEARGYACALLKREEDRPLAERLAELPTPCGLFAVTDGQASRAYAACREAGARIPEDFSVIGVDNDPGLCPSLVPPLASVDCNAQGVGFEAASVLEGLLEGRPTGGGPHLVPPEGVVIRASLGSHPDLPGNVAFAVRYIAAHACDPLRIEELLDHLQVSRRTLEKQFRGAVGRTLHQEIRRVQMERARKLLRETHCTIREISARIGLADHKCFSRIFRQAFGQTPTEYRRSEEHTELPL